MSRWQAVLFCVLICSPTAVQGQEPRPDQTPDSTAVLSPSAVDGLLAFVNDPRTIRLTGPSRVPAGRTIVGDMAVVDGPLIVAGRIEGDLVVLNGSLELQPDAFVTGDVTVVGGTIDRAETARLSGDLTLFPERLPTRFAGDQIIVLEPATDGDDRWPSLEWGGRWGESDFVIALGQSYNRVEGLPITFGPRIETAGSNPLRVEALAVYRTESGLTVDTDRLGYFARAQQYLAGRRASWIGASVYSVVDPIEEWHLTDLENGLATFLLHRDFRDHFERRGGSVSVGHQPLGSPSAVRVEGRWEKHGSVAAGSPWTLFRNAAEWRAQPLVAEGDLGSVLLAASYDTRADTHDPAWGWYLRGHVEQAFHSDLERPRALQALPFEVVPPEIVPVEAERFGRFTSAFLDLRRYNRVSPDSRLNFRLVVGGALSGSPLPPQRQHAFGGEGSLPGYDLFRFDCGARSEVVVSAGAVPPSLGGDEAAAFVTRYGCDRFFLFQAEYRGQLDFRFEWGSDSRDADPGQREAEGWETGWSAAPDLVIFVDAARGWAIDRPGTEGLGVDVGVGLSLGNVGVYAALPLNGGDGLNVFARLGPRF